MSCCGHCWSLLWSHCCGLIAVITAVVSLLWSLLWSHCCGHCCGLTAVVSLLWSHCCGHCCGLTAVVSLLWSLLWSHCCGHCCGDSLTDRAKQQQCVVVWCCATTQNVHLLWSRPCVSQPLVTSARSSKIKLSVGNYIT